MKKLLAKIRKILKDRRTRQLLTRIVSVTAAIVVFVTTYALVLPAITMETEAQCGIPAHQHDDSCYEEILTCEIPESEGHHHTEDCYTTKQELDCKVEEHQHGADCYDADGNLVCGLNEHTHSVDNGCYEEVRELTCEIPESDGHQHDSSCYEKVLTCGKEVHTHSAECYSDSTTADTEYAAVEISSGGGTSAAAASTGNAEAGVDNAASGTGTAESAGKALTIVDNAEAGITEDGHYVPELAPINFSTVLDNHTGIYYHAVEDGEVIEDSTALTYDKWNRVKDNTELGTADLLRVYLAYTIPAGALNPTNPVARYRLPGNLHLSDAQVKAISETVNGIASQYVNMDTLEILDTEKYYAYLGIEAVEGTRTPIDDPDKYLADISRKTGTTASEYISATIRVENVYDEQSGELTAQDLVFTWTPYTIEKNQHEYDSTGNPTKAGEEISGWLSLDFNMDQVDWDESAVDTFDREIETVEDRAVETVERREQKAEIVFVEEGEDAQGNKIRKISTRLTAINEAVVDSHTSDDQSVEQENTPETISDGEAEEDTEHNLENSGESNTGGTTDAREDADVEDPAIIMPAMSFNDSITVRTGKPANVTESAGGTLANAAETLPEEAEVTVRVEADEGTFPVGTTMKLAAVDNIDEVAKAVTETVESASTDVTASGNDAEAEQNRNENPEDIEKQKSEKPANEEQKNLKTYGFQAVDITFVDAEGNEVEPAKPVRVALTSETVEKAKKDAENSSVVDPVVVHVDDEGNAEQIELVVPEEIEPAVGRSEEEIQRDLEAEKAGDTAAPGTSDAAQPGEETSSDAAADTDAVDKSNIPVTADTSDAASDYGTDSNAATWSTTAEGNKADTAKTESADDSSTVGFTTDSFSVYAIVYTVELYTHIITDAGETYRISVTYDETSGISQDAELKVREIKEDDVEYENYYTEAVKAASGSSDVRDVRVSDDLNTNDANGKSDDVNERSDAETAVIDADEEKAEEILENKKAYARFFDIEILADGHKVEPTGDVSVSIRLLDVPESDEQNIIKIVHFAEEGTEVIPHTAGRGDVETGRDTETNDDENQNTEKEIGNSETETMTEFNFTANSFSVYSVVSYTVDFHWQVDGKEYEFRLPGGGFVSFTKLMEVMGAAKRSSLNDSGEAAEDIQRVEDATNKTVLYIADIPVSDETKRFVADVESVKFSTPALLSVSKAEENTTVGAIKNSLGLECEYSSELTEEDIEKINAAEVEGGDWAMISLKAFDSEETLTVTMKTGEVFTVKVTDARVGTDLDGKKYVIASQNNLAMTADNSAVSSGYLSANPVTGNGNQIWLFEHDSSWDHTYRLKSETENKYILMDSNGNLGLTDSHDSASLFWVDEENGTYQFSSNIPPRYLTTAYLNTSNSGGSDRYSMGSDWSQRFTLQEAKTTDKKGDWLLFLDEEQDDIYIHVGDTITLRPYDKWTWKNSTDTDAEYRWKFDNITGAPSDWSLTPYGTTNEHESSKATWRYQVDNKTILEFNRHVKYDDQLITRYWSIQGEAKNPGEYVLKNTANDHEITIHVLPAADTSHQLGTFTGTDRIKVNLFDYDRYGNLDPADDSNNTGSFNQAINYNNKDLKFSSSGGGSGINRYTRDAANPGIVWNKLVNGYPVLNSDHNKSLDYLFDTSKTSWSGGNNSNAIIAYPNLTGLFQQDTSGYYYYNSNSNYAYYNPANNNKSITLYEHTYTQVNKTSQLFNSKPIGFFPFHDYKSTGYENLYVNQNKSLNHHIGMSMEVKFALPSGKVTKDGKPISFEFTGDDDIWVFVDDDLTLDLGGIHQPIYGKIDFTNDDSFVAGKEYTLRVFYLERGGCDSNCAIRFNMPLTIGTADVRVVKHDKEQNTPLQGADFAIWENEDCTGEPLRRATSDGSGNVHFESLPIFEVGQVYYMKETKAPGSYFLDSTVYLLTAERIGQTDNFRFNITVNKPGADPLAMTTVPNPVPIVDNTKAQPIDLTVRKEWQDTDGTNHVPDGATATFKIKRWMTYSLTNEEHPYQVNLINTSNNQVLSNGSRWAFAGDTLTINYKHTADSNGTVQDCVCGNNNIVALQLHTNNTGNEINESYTVNPDHANPNTHTINIRIPGQNQEFLYWCGNLGWFNGVLPHFTNGDTDEPSPRYTQGDSVRKPDTEYNDSTTEGIINLPYEDAWTRTIKDLPTTGERVIEGKTYTCYYDYYIEEINATPGYETIYLDKHNNNIPSSRVPDLATHEDGEQKIINRKLINVPVEKRWPDYEHAGYTWEAVLHMDYRDVPLDGSAPSLWAPYHEGESDEANYVITLGNTAGHSSSGVFQNLPMYVTRSDGKNCRREYSVVEQSYIVRENGTKVASFDGTTYYPDDNHKYALWYQHDAGEDSDYDDTDYPGEDDYNIVVYNMHENRTIQKDIGLTIQKNWKNESGQVISEVPNDYKSQFVLKRNVIVEYRNYENVSTPRDQWVWVKLDAGSNEQMLQVPPGRQMYIRGNLLQGKDPGVIVFHDSNNNEYQASMDDDPQFAAYNLFKVTFNAPSTGYTNKTSPFIVQLLTGSGLVVGEEDGFILSDSNDRQVIGVDSTFSREFELSNEKGWSKVFPKTVEGPGTGNPQEQFENEHQLPAIEVSTLDASGNTANTYIYTYYFEEVECMPEGFYATYTDSNGNLIGDVSQQFYSDETITATNKPLGFDVLKVDQDRTSVKLPGAEFKLRKLEDGPNGGYPVSTNNGTFNGTEIDTQTTAQGTGKASFLRRPSTSGTGFLPGLLPGYYEAKETQAPRGYSLYEDVLFYVHVEETGRVTLLKKQNVQNQEGVLTLVEAGPNEMVGKATLSAVQTENGQSIVVTVRNEPGVELPAAGGTGTKLIYLLGSLLTVVSLLLLYQRKCGIA